MKPNTDNDRKSANGIRQGMPCGRSIPVITVKLTPCQIAHLSTEDLCAITERARKEYDDRRWATDPLELMDKIKEVVKEVVAFTVLFLVAMSS